MAQNPLAGYEAFVEYVEPVNLNNVEVDNQPLDHNLSNMWMSEGERALGFIGPNFQRLRIRFLSVTKDTHSKNIYFVLGKRKIRKIVRNFKGRLVITYVYKIKNTQEIEDHESGLILGTYYFKENPKLSDTGRFEGKFVSYWYKDDNGTIRYNDLWNVSDGFNNNQFIGKWKSYSASISLRANWGDGRIPLSEELDVGAGEFTPNVKYIQYGWESFTKAWVGGFSTDETKKARKKEIEVWWK